MTVVVKYTASSLEEIADVFDSCAQDQLNRASPKQTKKDKIDCCIKASIWKDAANILRNTSIIPTESQP